MSGPRGRIFASHTITIRALIGVIFSLVVAGLICTLLTFPRALAASIVSDDFNDNSIDTAKWNPTISAALHSLISGRDAEIAP